MLKAGRELDKLVAEKIMGWVQHVTPALKPGEPFRLYPGAINNLEDLVSQPEPYSTDIAAAWEVWDEMTRMRQYDAEVTYTGSNGFCVQFGKNGEWFDSTRDDNREIDGMPFHICLAALKAVGVDRLGIP